MNRRGLFEPEDESDSALSHKYGPYASFITDDGPESVEFIGPSPAEEFERYASAFLKPDSCVLDLGCGAGFEVCRMAPDVREVWGLDQNSELLQAAQSRVQRRGLRNVRLLNLDVSDPRCADELAGSKFDLVLSRRGPFATAQVMPSVKENAVCVIELFQDHIGLKQLFGRTPFLPVPPTDPDFTIRHMAGLEWLPVCSNTYWFNEWFRDEEHLKKSLARAASLSNWWMEECPFDQERDGDALRLYGKYMKSDRGIRLQACRKIFVFTRGQTSYYPAVNPG